MHERIAKGLAAQFETQRIVVWTDPQGEMRDLFEKVALPGVTKIRLDNDEFGVKYRVLRKEPKAKFLIYRDAPQPPLIHNWILDIELAHGTFKADQVAIWRTELGLPDRFDVVVSAHAEFFKSSKRLDKLKTLLRSDDTERDVRLRMLAVCVGTDGDLDAVLEALLREHADNSDEAMRLMTRVGLQDFLWQQVAQRYGYRAAQPGIKDFAIALFRSSLAAQSGGGGALTADSVVFFRRWQNNRHNKQVFEALSDEISGEIGVESEIEKRDFRTLIDADAFEVIDRVLIRRIIDEVAKRRVPSSEVLAWVRQRRQTFWYGERYRDLYEAIAHAADFHDELARAQFGITSLSEGVKRYAGTWYRIDQLYRKFILHVREAAQPTLTDPLFEQVENHYVNGFLTKLNEAWQKQIDECASWGGEGLTNQRAFYSQHVGAFRRKGQRICVIISDAMRFEVAHELLMRVRAIDRYDAEIEPMLGVLPSYTQLGMAALLPHKRLEIADNDSGTVLVDGQAVIGLEARRKILADGRTDDRADAMKAEDFLGLNKEESRARLTDADVLYLYHNKIDARGDKLATEHEVFNAVEDAIDDIVKLVKKLAAANASNVIVTADHGFLYQHRPIEESEFASAAASGDKVLFTNRRFVLGHGLAAAHGLRHFSSADAGLEGNIEILIPKSINRLRRQGSGSRFVHGGATLQEVVVPVVTISKKRQSDTSIVDVALLSPAKSITSAQHAVVLYQEAAVSEKVQPRTLRVGLWSASGKPISDLHTVSFDMRSENPRDREMPIRLLLSRDADAHNGEDVVLRLEEPIDGTTHLRLYRETRYRLQRSIATDFDF